jgi:hypothetical protein
MTPLRMSPRLEAPPTFRRGVLLVAMLLAAAEAGLFLATWRLGLLLDPGADRRATLAFVVLGSALTLQAMAVVGVGWTLVALSRTTAAFDGEILELAHPWRAWSGRWPQVAHAWHRGGWLTLELTGSFRRWHVRVPDDGKADVERLRAHLGQGVWLEGRALTGHILYRVLPVILGSAGLGGLALIGLLHYLRRVLG